MELKIDMIRMWHDWPCFELKYIVNANTLRFHFGFHFRFSYSFSSNSIGNVWIYCVSEVLQDTIDFRLVNVQKEKQIINAVVHSSILIFGRLHFRAIFIFLKKKPTKNQKENGKSQTTNVLFNLHLAGAPYRRNLG